MSLGPLDRVPCEDPDPNLDPLPLLEELRTLELATLPAPPGVLYAPRLGVIPLPLVDEEVFVDEDQNHEPPSTGNSNEMAEIITCLVATKPEHIEYENQSGPSHSPVPVDASTRPETSDRVSEETAKDHKDASG